MIILSIDSAGTGCGAAVWRDGTILAEQTESMERGQDQRLMPLVLEVMKKAGTGFDDLDRIAVTRGPGSFTGLRIGLAAARGIGLAANKPVIGIDRFSIFRMQATETGKNLLVIINSRRKELFCRFYPAQGAASEATMMTEDEIRDFLATKADTNVIGDMVLPGIGSFLDTREKETVTAAALAAKADPNDLAFLPRPLYLRAPDVTMKKSQSGIQTVSLQQAPLLAAIHAASFGAAAWSLEQIKGSLALETTRGWAAFENGQPVGFILCQALPEQAEILTFAVHPDAQRRGFGERLLKKAIENTSNGRVFLEVAADNGVACQLYEKHGFRKSGIRPNYYTQDGKAVDAILYEKTLSP